MGAQKDGAGREEGLSLRTRWESERLLPVSRPTLPERQPKGNSAAAPAVGYPTECTIDEGMSIAIGAGVSMEGRPK